MACEICRSQMVPNQCKQLKCFKTVCCRTEHHTSSSDHQPGLRMNFDISEEISKKKKKSNNQALFACCNILKPKHNPNQTLEGNNFEVVFLTSTRFKTWLQCHKMSPYL